tara:strand:- start:2325 stop:2738 length:414 start_codon:yes stop_codon:yes gene_type:complete
MKHSLYHIVLRTGALTLALLLVFDSGLLSPVTARISQNTQDYVGAAIGMYAAVEPSELNQYTAELTARDRVLTEREQDIAAREIAVDLAESGQTPDYSTYIISVLLFVILVLIVLNYTLDYMRAREQLAMRRNEKVA